MADINYNDIPNIETDWQGYSGQSVQKFIKEQLNTKMGMFYFDATNNRYLVFASEEKKNEYIADSTLTNLVLGTFDAPFNYSAEITLTSNAYNAVPLGSTGNYIEFTFKIVNKQNADTGENVNITYTFMRNAVKQTVNEVRKHGDVVRFNIDKYLGEGTNTIMVTVTGQNTLASTTAAITYQVVNLTLEDEMDISKVCDISKGSAVIEVPFKVSGYGTKVVEWYIDGEKLAFIKNEDEAVDSTVSRIKYISVSNLQQGRHSLQIRAYTAVNGEAFYTDVLYRDFFVYTGISSEFMLGIAATIPVGYGVLGATDNTIIYGLEQYVPYNLRFASYSPSNLSSVPVSITFDGESKGVVSSSNNLENKFTLVPTKSGNKTLVLSAGDISYTIPVDVLPTKMNIEEITSDLDLDFTALGKSNNTTDKNTWTDGVHTATLSGFNFNNTSGWVDGRLEINAGASFSIDYAPLSGNPTNTGKTVEIEWSTKNVSNDNAIICDLRADNGAGILITATKVTLTSANGVVVETEYNSGENVRMGFVINRSSGISEQKLSYIYCNGIISRAEAWAETDNYTSNKNITFVGTEEAEVSLKAIKVYNTALTSSNMLNNFILYRDTVSEMMNVYDRNDIYESGGAVFSTDKISSRLPVMIVTGDIPTLENTSDKDTQIVVDIEYINMQNPSKSFKMVNAAMRPQGTSSMGYPKKNFRIYTTKLDNTIVYDASGNEIKDKLYSFKDNAQPVDCWCLKADYAESSGTHNTGIARMWNDALKNVQLNGEYVCRTTAQKAALEAGYKYDVRTTIDGFPILLFYRPSVNDELIFIGKYNFNNDKSTESVFGFTGIPNFDNSKMQCWEVLNNGNPLALFTTMEGFDKGWSEAFESRYPDTKTPNTADLKAFCQWMTTVSQADFATQKWEHLNVYMMAAYWVYLMRHAGVDQFVKNAMFTSEDGLKWYYILYDNDTINGLINIGRLRVTPTDDRQTIDDSGAYVFAGHDSRLWNMLEADEEFNNIVKEIDNALYSAGISYKEAVKVFDEQQADKWVERVYNQDAQYKYIGPYVEKGVNNLFMLQGKRDLHRKWWLAKRYSIFDAKYVSGPYKSQAVELKCINGTPEGQEFKVTAGYPLDYGYGINNVPRESGITLAVGQSHTFTTAEVVNLGDPIRIYGAPNIAELDLSKMASQLAVITIANVYDETLGTKLKKLIIGNISESNMEVSEISGLKQAERLEYLDVQGMKAMTSLDLTNQSRLTTVLAKNSSISSISFAKGAPVTKLGLPSTMTSLTIEQLPYLNAEGIEFENLRQIRNITVKACPNVSNNYIFIRNWINTKATISSDCTLVMDSINWTNVDTDTLIKISEIGTLNLKGRVVLANITLEQLNVLMSVFGETAFDKNSDFFIDAPNAVFVSGPTDILEGSITKYSCIIFGGEAKNINWTIISGGNSTYTSIDSNGVLTILEGGGSRTLVVRALVTTDEGIKMGDTTVNVSARVYPSSSNTSIIGDTRLDNEYTTYLLSVPDDTNGEYNVAWSLAGLEGYAEITSSNNKSCVIRKIAESLSSVSGTLNCVLTKKYNNSNLFTISKAIEVVNDSIAETDAGICQALYDAGLCANNTYITKDEAAVITSEDLQPNQSSSSGSIFAKKRSLIKSFDGFKWFVSVGSILGYTFYNCNKLKSITLPSCITNIGKNAFASCTSLTSIDIPDSVTEIKENAFYNCTSLISINLPKGITSISSGVFQNCGSLTSITIPDGVTSIKGEAFRDCEDLTSIDIPDSVTEINDTAFSRCNSLNINVSSDNLVYSSIDGVLFNKTQTTIVKYAKDKIQPNYTIPNSVTSIGSRAFYYCRSLTTINIPDSVASIGSSAFYYCYSLTSANIPKGITRISDSMFSYCTSLTTITIPDGVISIGSSAFNTCTSLTTITLPESVTSIESSTLVSCQKLKTIISLNPIAPTVTSNSFGTSDPGFTGYNTRDTGENMLYVPKNATGYDTSYWLDPLQNANKCGFTLSATL